MGRSYKFAIIRFAPDETRGENLNIGVLIFRETDVDIRMTRRLDRVRAISGAVDLKSVESIVENLRISMLKRGETGT
jgi:hypothetical protein